MVVPECLSITWVVGLQLGMSLVPTVFGPYMSETKESISLNAQSVALEGGQVLGTSWVGYKRGLPRTQIL